MSFPPMQSRKVSHALRDQAHIFFAWMVRDKAEGVPCRHCHRDEGHIRFPAWLSSRVSPANFHDGIVGQSTKFFTHEFWLDEKDVLADTKRWSTSQDIQPAATESSFPTPENTLDLNGIMASSSWDGPTRAPSSVVNKQPAQQAPVAKTLATPMPRTRGRGLAPVRPRWMTVASSPSPFAPQPMAAHVFQPSPCGFSLDYKGSLPGRAGVPNTQDDDLGGQSASGPQTVADFAKFSPLPVQTTPNLSWRMRSSSPPASVSASAKPMAPVLQTHNMQRTPEPHA